MNIMQMIQQFNQFKQTYTGNAQEDVQKLLQSGKMTQAQLNNLQRQATMIQNLMNNMK